MIGADGGKERTRIAVVGAGTRFLSGPAYYTLRLANALADAFEVRLVTMRQLVPTRLYPGYRRVAKRLTTLSYRPDVSVHDGVDWHWGPSMARGLAHLVRPRPRVVIFQWWTGAVLHSYVLLALAARAAGARVIVEFHEVMDPGEARIAPVRWYVQFLGRRFMNLSDAFVVHVENDLDELRARFRLGGRPVAVIPHGPFDQHVATEPATAVDDGVHRILFFGLIRPYKGLEDLVRAFDGLDADEAAASELSVVGETWEGWNLPAELIESNRHRSRIRYVGRYVTDEEVAAEFSRADVVVFPYRRSSGSGALELALAHGLPVIVSDVPGLQEAVRAYAGAITVPVGDVDLLQRALREARGLRGQRFRTPHSWQETIDRYAALVDLLTTHDGPASSPQGSVPEKAGSVATDR